MFRYTAAFSSAMVVINPDCEGVWVWDTCTLTVSISDGASYQIRASGDLGWRVQGTFMVGEEGKLVGQEMKAVCQPLQVPEVPQDENMKKVHKLLRNLSNVELDGAKYLTQN